MESDWILDRAKLHELHLAHPDWGARRLKRQLARSLTWTKKWLRRFRGADPDDEDVLLSRSRARKTSPKKVSRALTEQILAIRDEPPNNLRRVPGPKTILYFLHKDPTLKQQNLYLPRSTRTVWQILRQNGRIYRPKRPEPEPEERPEPLQEWGIDFKDVTTVPADPDGRKQHGVECLNMLDHGTSILMSAQVRKNYTMVSAIEALITAFRTHGCPQSLRFDRDARFIGGWNAGQFPTAFLRLLLCLNITPNICPPHRPDKNGFVERYNKSYKYECLYRDKPTTLEHAQAYTLVYQNHYNFERPNQAITCGNQPPRVAFPVLPTLAALPAQLNPDHWLTKINGKLFKRRVQANGSVRIGRYSYYIKQTLKKRQVLLQVAAKNQQFLVRLEGKEIKRLPIKGLHNEQMLLEDYFTLLLREAESEWQRYLHKKRHYPR